jgi:hypothetical protein
MESVAGRGGRVSMSADAVFNELMGRTHDHDELLGQVMRTTSLSLAEATALSMDGLRKLVDLAAQARRVGELQELAYKKQREAARLHHELEECRRKAVQIERLDTQVEAGVEAELEFDDARKPSHPQRRFVFVTGDEVDVDKIVALDANAPSSIAHISVGHGTFVRVRFGSDEQRREQIAAMRAFRDGSDAKVFGGAAKELRELAWDLVKQWELTPHDELEVERRSKLNAIERLNVIARDLVSAR